MTIDTSTCSERFLRGVKWLEQELRFDESRAKAKLEDKKAKLEAPELRRIYSLQERQIERLRKRLLLKYRISEIQGIYSLSKIDSEVVSEFVSATKSSDFWIDSRDFIYDDWHTLWFLKDLRLSDNTHVQEEIDAMIQEQSVQGYLQSNSHDHVGPLRVLVAMRPESKSLRNAVDYWRKNRNRIDKPADIAVGVLAITELDSFGYSIEIQQEIDRLKQLQNSDGSWGSELTWDKVDETAYSAWAISRVNGIKDLSACKGLDWLHQTQSEEGSWESATYPTGIALIGLLAMGEGPKVPSETVRYQYLKLEQSLRKQKPLLVHTSPIYKNSFHISEIRDKVFEMIHGAEKEVRIASPFIDMLYEEIISLANQHPEITVKIICRPKREVKGMRERIAKNVIDLLRIAARGNVVETEVVHSRMVIIDEKEVLVSSADLTRDQLFDEFNAGIWTADPETVNRAVEFFDNIFELEEQR